MHTLLLVGAFIALYVVLKVAQRPNLTPERAHELLAGGARLVDVRSRAEFGARHLTGAINVPIDEITSRAAELGPKDQPIILYCQSGARSARAARALKSAGYRAVFNLGSMHNGASLASAG